MSNLDRMSSADYIKMSKQELKERLEELRALLKEVEEERLVVLGQDNLHLHNAVAKNYEDELEQINRNIQLIKGIL